MNRPRESRAEYISEIEPAIIHSLVNIFTLITRQIKNP